MGGQTGPDESQVFNFLAPSDAIADDLSPAGRAAPVAPPTPTTLPNPS